MAGASEEILYVKKCATAAESYEEQTHLERAAKESGITLNAAMEDDGVVVYVTLAETYKTVLGTHGTDLEMYLENQGYQKAPPSYVKRIEDQHRVREARNGAYRELQYCFTFDTKEEAEKKEEEIRDIIKETGADAKTFLAPDHTVYVGMPKAEESIPVAYGVHIKPFPQLLELENFRITEIANIDYIGAEKRANGKDGMAL